MHERVVPQTVSGAATWSRRAEAGLGVLTGGVHTSCVGWFGPEGPDKPRLGRPHRPGKHPCDAIPAIRTDEQTVVLPLALLQEVDTKALQQAHK